MDASLAFLVPSLDIAQEKIAHLVKTLFHVHGVFFKLFLSIKGSPLKRISVKNIEGTEELRGVRVSEIIKRN